MPRGRVLYRMAEDRYVVFLPSTLARDGRLLARLRKRFQLPRGKVVVECDVHYDPPCDALFEE